MDMLRNSACIKLFAELEISGDCIVYTGSGVGKGGYGRITVSSDGERRSYSAHRLAYEMKHGEIPSGVLVRHTCHNPACVRPSHLKKGSDFDNAQDRVNAGRCAPQDGANNGNAKLTEEERLEVIRRRERGETLKSIAADYGVHFSTISVIAKRGR